jgi:hypothetical protein
MGKPKVTSSWMSADKFPKSTYIGAFRGHHATSEGKQPSIKTKVKLMVVLPTVV